jgi:hypothetical protein
LDFDAHATVVRGSCDAQWRTGGLIGVEDAVGHQFGDQQAGVGALVGLGATVEPT